MKNLSRSLYFYYQSILVLFVISSLYATKNSMFKKSFSKNSSVVKLKTDSKVESKSSKSNSNEPDYNSKSVLDSNGNSYSSPKMIDSINTISKDKYSAYDNNSSNQISENIGYNKNDSVSYNYNKNNKEDFKYPNLPEYASYKAPKIVQFLETNGSSKYYD